MSESDRKSLFAPFILHKATLERKKYINIEAGHIDSITEHPAFPDSIINLPDDRIIFPGCINTHSHAFQSLLRGYTNDCTLEQFLEVVYTQLESYTADDIYTGSKIAFDEMLQNGITTVCDFFYINGDGNNFAEQVIKAAEDVGIRINLMRCLIDRPEKSDSVRENIDDFKSNFRSLFQKYSNSHLIRISPCAHSVYYTTLEGITAVKELANEYDVKWQIHFSDSQGTRDYCQKKYGKTNAEYMADNDLMDKNMVAVHGIWCNKSDIKLMAKRGVMLSHNPLSNQFLGERAALIPEMIESGIKIGLGTDGAASNPSLNIFQEMKAAILMQKSRFLDPTKLTAAEGFNMATNWGGQISGFNAGDLSKDHTADFIVCDTNHPSFKPDIEKAFSHYVYSISSSAINEVYVHGNKIK